MDLRHLRYFITVAEEHNFTRAAERLRTAQPSLSQQIKRLEDLELGVILFNRDKHHVELTAAGRAFLPEARFILESTERAIALARRAARGETGQLTIAFIPGAEGKVFAHVLPAMRAQHPEIQFTLRSLATPEQILALREGTIDVGFLRPPLEGPDLSSEVVLRDEILAVVPARHEFAKLDRIPVASLAKLPLIQVARKVAPAIHDITASIAEAARVTFRPLMETDNVLSTLNAIGAGLGFSLLPDYVRSIGPSTVAARSLTLQPPPHVDLVVAYRNDGSLPVLGALLPILRAWIDRPPKIA